MSYPTSSFRDLLFSPSIRPSVGVWTHPDVEIYIEAAHVAGPFQRARFTGALSLLCRGVGGDAAGFYHALVGLHRHRDLFCQVGLFYYVFDAVD